MAFDETLAERVRPLVGEAGIVVERKMFGGIAWMVNGNMACGVLHDELLVRMEEQDAQRLLAGEHTRPFAMTGRPAKNFVLVAPEASGEDAELARWVGLGVDYALSLPPK